MSAAPARRVLLWDYHPLPEVIDELARCGYTVVATVQGQAEGTPFIPLRAFFDCELLPALQRSPVRTERPSDAEFRAYALGASRISRVPFTGEITLDLGGGLAADEMEARLRQHLQLCLDLLHTLAVDEVWFTSVPHFGIDQAMAMAAERAEVPVLSLRQLPFPAKFDWCWSGPARPAITPPAFDAWTRGALPLDLFYMTPRQWDAPGRAWSRRARQYLGSLLRGRLASSGARLWRAAVDRQWWGLAFALEALDPASRAAAARHRQALREHRRQPRAWRRLQDIAQQFVYFALHYEPEANADVYGADYAFQPDALRALSRALPADWVLVVKENPVQGFARRGEAFARTLDGLPGLVWVDPATPGAALLERAALVATLCGSVGYEALLRGKACLYFGDPWYAGLPGAHRHSADLDLQQLAQGSVDRQALDAAMNARLSAAADGIAYRRYSALLPAEGESEAMLRRTARSLAAISQAAAAP